MRMILHQANDVLNAASRNVVTIEIQVLQLAVVAHRRGDAFEARIIKTGVAQH